MTAVLRRPVRIFDQIGVDGADQDLALHPDDHLAAVVCQPEVDIPFSPKEPLEFEERLDDDRVEGTCGRLDAFLAEDLGVDLPKLLVVEDLEGDRLSDREFLRPKVVIGGKGIGDEGGNVADGDFAVLREGRPALGVVKDNLLVAPVRALFLANHVPVRCERVRK